MGGSQPKARSRSTNRISGLEPRSSIASGGSGSSSTELQASVETRETGRAFSKVEIFLKCEQLHRSCMSFVVVYTRSLEDEAWTEQGRTEVHKQRSASPSYDSGIAVPFAMETAQFLRLEVYRCRDESDMSTLRDQQFLGCAETTIVEAVYARSEGVGWLKRPLESLKQGQRSQQAFVSVWAEEDFSGKGSISWNMKGFKLRKTDFWNSSVNPYVLLYIIEGHVIDKMMTSPRGRGRRPGQAEQEGQDSEKTTRDIQVEDFEHLDPKDRRLTVHSAVIKRKRSPKWHERVEVSGQGLGQKSGESDNAIFIEVWDFYKAADHRLVGSCVTNFKDVFKAFQKSIAISMDLQPPPKPQRKVERKRGGKAAFEEEAKQTAGQLTFDKISVQRQYTFLDFVRGGLQLKLIVAVDCTRSNLDPLDPHSPHYLDGKELNNYAVTIRALADVIGPYAGDGKYPAYGFGAKVPPTNTICSDCFSLTGDWFFPQVKGVDELIEAYKNAMRVVRLHGPTKLQRVVEVASDWARPHAEVKTPNSNGVDMKYFVLLILSDGGVDDHHHMVNAMVEASELPLSIVIVDISVGDNQMQGVSKEVQIAQEFADRPVRDFVRFVKYCDYYDKPAVLAAEALVKIPKHVSDYYKMIDVLPRDLEKFEDKHGMAFPRQHFDDNTGMMGFRNSAPNARAGMIATHDVQGGLTVADDAVTALRKKREALEEMLAQLPPFLRETRNNALKAAESLGYEQNVILRVLRDGVADDTMAVFIENMVHCGYGKCATFKETLQEAAKAAKQSALDESNWDIPSTSLTSANLLGSLDSPKNLERKGPNAVTYLKPMDDYSDITTPPSSAFFSPTHSQRSTRSRSQPSSSPRNPKRRKDNVHVDAAQLPGAVSEVGMSADDTEVAAARHNERVRTVVSPQRARNAFNEQCTICMENRPIVEFVPCAHKVACEECTRRLGKICPLCRGMVRDYKSEGQALIIQDIQ